MIQRDMVLKTGIQNLAADIIEIYGIIIPILDIEVVVRKLGGKVIKDKKAGTFRGGIIRKELDRDYNFSIRIPANLPLSRKNSAIARQLGHLFLHMGYDINAELWENSDYTVFPRYGNPAADRQVNEFAAAFLMPEDIYQEVIRNNTEGNRVFIRKVAEYFNVSMDDVIYRGRQLGCLA